MGLARYYLGQFVRRQVPSGLRRYLERARRDLANRKKQRAATLRQRKYGTLTADELTLLLLDAGVRSGGVLLVHSSFGEFSNFAGTALDLLELLERLVGPGGTLVMPAQCVSKRNQFNVQRDPASVGILCELFRRREGTVRSAHPGQSVCARGPLAADLVADHHRHPLGCGPRSPFAKLLDYKAQVLGLGLPPLWTTFLHVVEDLDLEAYPWTMYGEEKRQFKVIDAHGESSEITIPMRDAKILARIDPRGLAKHVSDRGQRAFHVKGIPCFVADCVPLYEELRTLAARGITAYGSAPSRVA